MKWRLRPTSLLLLTLLRAFRYQWSVVTRKADFSRPEIEAAARGGDVSRGMDDEAEVASASMEVALFWQNVYREVLAMEVKVLERIHELMASQSPEGRREVELTNVPVVASQAQRFRDRLGLWDARVRDLE